MLTVTGILALTNLSPDTQEKRLLAVDHLLAHVVVAQIFVDLE